jgi:hypothetical protein
VRFHLFSPIFLAEHITLSYLVTTLSKDGESPKLKAPISGISGKEGAKNVPSWVRGERPNVGESGKDFADRLLGAKYGIGNFSTGTRTEHNQIKKWGDKVTPKVKNTKQLFLRRDSSLVSLSFAA